jgi:hypothetical protein
MYDHLLGGKDNFAADREAAAKLVALVPEAQKIARDNRSFLVRVVRYLAEAGVGQFIDLGTGIPTSPNVHEIARQVVPGARVVYVDHDPVVLAHSRALLATDDGVVAIKADFRDSDEVLAHPSLTHLIDFSQPVAVLILSVLHFNGDEEIPRQMVSGFVDQMAPGGYLVISTITSEGLNDTARTGVRDLYRAASTPAAPRTSEETAKFFAGCELVEPGLVDVVQWRPDADTDTVPTQVHMLGGVGRKL